MTDQTPFPRSRGNVSQNCFDSLYLRFQVVKLAYNWYLRRMSYSIFFRQDVRLRWLYLMVGYSVIIVLVVVQMSCRPGGAQQGRSTASRSSVSSSIGGLSSPTGEEPMRPSADPSLPTEQGYVSNPQPQPPLPRRDSQGNMARKLYHSSLNIRRQFDELSLSRKTLHGPYGDWYETSDITCDSRGHGLFQHGVLLSKTIFTFPLQFKVESNLHFFTVSQSSVTSSSTRPALGRQSSQTQLLGEDSEDTMKNLRKTFAGIFGDM